MRRKYGLIVVMWDNVNAHISAALRQRIDAWDWQHVIRLPSYAPDLNLVDAVSCVPQIRLLTGR